MTTEPKRPPGRPAGSQIVTPNRARVAAELQRNGKTVEEIAHVMDCGKTSVVALLAMARDLEREGVQDSKPDLIVVQRTYAAPLQFRGRLLNQGSTEFLFTKPDKPNMDVWDGRIYQVLRPEDDSPSGYVIVIDYHKTHKGQSIEHHHAQVTHDLVAAFREYNPLDVLSGYPPDDRFAAQQKALEAACKRQYQELVRQLLQPFPEELTIPQSPLQVTIEGDEIRVSLQDGSGDLLLSPGEARGLALELLKVAPLH